MTVFRCCGRKDEQLKWVNRFDVPYGSTHMLEHEFEERLDILEKRVEELATELTEVKGARGGADPHSRGGIRLCAIV